MFHLPLDYRSHRVMVFVILAAGSMQCNIQCDIQCVLLVISPSFWLIYCKRRWDKKMQHHLRAFDLDSVSRHGNKTSTPYTFTLDCPFPPDLDLLGCWPKELHTSASPEALHWRAWLAVRHLEPLQVYIPRYTMGTSDRISKLVSSLPPSLPSGL